LQHVPSPQALPHVPQLPLSYWRSTQAPLHQTSLAWQTETHSPSLQHAPPPHALPQAPQLSLSF
jgi:hypothetical protein